MNICAPRSAVFKHFDRVTLYEAAREALNFEMGTRRTLARHLTESNPRKAKLHESIKHLRDLRNLLNPEDLYVSEVVLVLIAALSATDCSGGVDES